VVSIHCLACFTRALPSELHDHGPVRYSNPDQLGYKASAHPTGFGRHCRIGTYHAASSGVDPSSVLRKRREQLPTSGFAGTAGNSVTSSVATSALLSRTTSFSRLCRMEYASFQVVREEGVEPSSQGSKPCVLPLDDSRADSRWKGQWVPPPLLVGGSHACICQHLDPVEQ
jgi:hypothetical protein